MARPLFPLGRELLLWTISLCLLRRITSAPCYICTDPSISVSLPQETVTVPQLGTVSCETLEGTLPLLLTDDDDRCQLIQSVSTICGCPLTINVTDPCRMCSTNSEDDEVSVPEEWKSTPVVFQGQDATCALAELSLTTVESTSIDCQDGQTLASSCGCSDGDDANVDVEPPPTSTPPVAFEPCTPCWDGSEIMRPDKNVNHLAENLGFPIPDGVNATCSAISDFMQTISSAASECDALRVVFGGACGCPKVPNSCELCPNDPDGVPNPDKLYVPSGLWLRNLPTCQESYDVLHQIPAGEEGRSILREALDLSRGHDFCAVASST